MPFTDKERAIVDFYLNRTKKSFPDFVNFILSYCPESEAEFNELAYRGKKEENAEKYKFLNTRALKQEFYDKYILIHKDLCKNAHRIHKREKSMNHTKSMREKKKEE